MSIAPTATARSARVSGVSRSYRLQRRTVQALRNVDKDFATASLTVIAGPSGSGKSSLLRILACVERPDTGLLEIGGHSLAEASSRRRRRVRRRSVGYVFQDPIDNLVDYLSAEDQVRLAGRLRGRQVDEGELAGLFAALHLDERRRHRPQQLSGGEQQRVAVACALVGSPSVVVADEPTAELDSNSAERVLDGVRALCDRGASFVIASHDPRLIERADHLLRLERGEVTESW